MSFLINDMSDTTVEVRIRVDRRLWGDLRRLAVRENKPAYILLTEALAELVERRSK